MSRMVRRKPKRARRPRPLSPVSAGVCIDQVDPKGRGWHAMAPTIEVLLQADFLAVLAQKMGALDFYRWSRTTDEQGRWLLHAEYAGGKTWIAAGVLSGDAEEIRRLPEWKPPVGSYQTAALAAPRHRTLRISRGEPDAEGKYPVFESTLALMKKRGVKVLDYEIDEAANEYLFRVMAAPVEMDAAPAPKGNA